MSDLLSVPVTTAIGAIAGMAEVTANQPLVYAKNCLQTNIPIQLNPLVAYRGYGVNVASVAPITAFQVAASTALYQSLENLQANTPHNPDTTMLVASLGAGALSGIIAGPCESVIIQQQKHGLNAKTTAQMMLQKAGVRGIFRGTTFCVGRESVYTAGFMSFGPQCINFLRSRDCNDVVARVGGGMLAGAIASVVTHPLDSLKTFLQDDYQKEKFSSATAAAKQGGLFKGLAPRMGRLVVGTVVIANINDILTNAYLSYARGKTPKLSNLDHDVGVEVVLGASPGASAPAFTSSQ